MTSLAQDQHEHLEASTKERILAAATAEFARLGLEGARVDRIARRASVNKAMIYYHFSSKENLYLAAIEHMLLPAREHLKAVADSSTELRALLSGLAAAYRRVFSDYSALKAILLREMANPSDRVLSHVAGILVGSGLPVKIRSLIEAEIKEGRIRKFPVEQIGVSFMTSILGGIFMAPIYQRVLGIHDLEKFLDTRQTLLVDMILDGIKSE